MFDYKQVEQDVVSYCGDCVEDYDINGIVLDLRYMYWNRDVYSLDDIDHEDFMEILQRHDLTEN